MKNIFKVLNFKTYEDAKKNFNWNYRWLMFNGNKDKFNIANECVDRHSKNDPAIRIKFSDGNSEVYNFQTFSQLTSKMANYLEKNGINFGDKVAILLFPSIEFYISMFGIFKRGAVVIPCFPLFGEEAINFRLDDSKAKAIITLRSMINLINEELIEKLGLKIIIADDLLDKIKKEDDTYNWKTRADDICMIQYSSGTTGTPKPIIYRHGAITVAAVVMRLSTGLNENDNYFCPSSPAWGHGIWYGTISPLIFGKAIGTYSGKYNPELVLEALEEWEITKMAAISSHYRLIIDTGKVDKYKIKLDSATYTGEAMPIEIIHKFKDVFGFYPGTQYGSTESGPVCLDFLAFDNWLIKPGSMGKPMIGGIKVKILDEQGNEVPPGVKGEITISKDGKTWVGLKDCAYRDEDGYFWYVSRLDDIIISSGYTIGPIEVEEVIKKHPAVEETAVVASHDKERGNVVKAFIQLKENYSPNKELEKEIKDFVKTRLSKHEYPRKIEFINEIPKTPDGKIKRKILKERELLKYKES